MELTIHVNPTERTVRFREVHALAAGDAYSLVTLSGVAGAQTAALQLKLFKDSSATAVLAQCSSFVDVPGHPSERRGAMTLATQALRDWYESIANDATATDTDGMPSALVNAWLVVSDSVKTWAACQVPLILRAMDTNVVQGADGISPTVALSKSGRVLTISVTDVNGTRTETVLDGEAGPPGASPAVLVDRNPSTGNTRITVVNADGSVSEQDVDVASAVASACDGINLRTNATARDMLTCLQSMLLRLGGTVSALLLAALPCLAGPGEGVFGDLGMDDAVVTNAVQATAAVRAADARDATNYVDRLRRDLPSGAPAPLPMYLHALDFADSYPDAAAEYYASLGSGEAGGCSAVRSGGFLCRNFDYPFDDRAEFVVRMSAGRNRFASVGVAQVGTNLTERTVTSGRPSRWYKALPGATVDGINENGVVAEINVVDTPVAGWRTNATEGAIHPLAAVRWALDNATDARTAAEHIAANIRFPSGWTQNFHYMVADAENTYVVENGTATDGDEYHEPDEPVAMTNFQLSKFPWDGMGKERFNLLLGGAGITNAWYTKAYRRGTAPPWTSDLADVIGYTNEIFDAWSTHPKEYFRGRTVNGRPWWQTVHTSVYDISNRTLRVAVQETDDWYAFAVPSTGGSDEKGGTDESAVRAIVGAFAATGAVFRALSVGTAEQWMDATGCVWRVEWAWTNSVLPGFVFTMRDDGWWRPSDAEYGFRYNEDSGQWVYVQYEAPFFVEGRADDPVVDLQLEVLGSFYRIPHATRLAGRVALTNDTMSRAEAEARFDAVDRPYSMIYDPVAGRALTADGRLVDYGRAPRISGRLAVAVDADSSYSSAGWPSGYLPSLALISGTNLVEGVDYTLVITPSGQTSDGAYTNATAQVQWRIVGTGYYSMSVLPVTATVTKTVSGESTTTSLALWSNYGYGSVCSIEVPDVGEGELGITDVVIDGHDVSVAWYFYSSGGYYSGVDVFSMEYDDNGGDGVHPTAYGDRGRFATVSDMQGYVTDAIDSRVGQMDSVRSLEIMRQDGMLEYGTGPGILKWDFVTDDRRWILNVPNLSASMNVFQNNDNWTDLTTWPMNLSTPPRSDLLERRFVRSWGDAGNGRCLASQWHVEAAFIDCIMQADVVVSNGVVKVLSSSASPYPQGMLFGCDPSYPNAKINLYRSFDDVGSGTAKARCYFVYTVNSGPSGAQPARPCISMSTAPGSYASVTCGYVRAISPVNKNYMWDAGLRRTWQVSVSNGSFFAEIVSTNNLLYTETHQ